MLDIQALEAMSRTLTGRAGQIIEQLGLMQVLQEHGRPELIGSASFGLMVKPDIDIGTLCGHLDPGAILTSFLPLASVAGVKELHLHDERGRLNQTGVPQDEGVYVGLRYVDGEGPDALTWKIDLWFFPEAAPRPEFPLRDRLRKATPGEREAILRIKNATVADGTYGRDVRGIDIYNAVLDDGVRTIKQWQGLCRQCREG